jgi:hypothetical protein
LLENLLNLYQEISFDSLEVSVKEFEKTTKGKAFANNSAEHLALMNVNSLDSLATSKKATDSLYALFASSPPSLQAVHISS